jgi:chemotaxis protein CheD
MVTRMLNINEVAVFNEPVELTCYGLGSCIGLFVTDRTKGISGGAHIPMAQETLNSELKGASEMIDELLKGLQNLGSDLTTLRAKMAGGAQVLAQASSTGDENAVAVRRLLVAKNIYVAASDVGGQISRTARFNSVSQELSISTSEQKQYTV